MRLTLPPVFALDESFGKNSLRRTAEISSVQEGTLASYTNGRLKGRIFHPESGDPILILSKPGNVPNGHPRVLLAIIDVDVDAIDLSDARWLRHPAIQAEKTDFAAAISEIQESWRNSFSFVEEDPAQSIVGLRKPQIGALHAVHAHWTVSDDVATTVMPTGTGKTDTMISILVSAACDKILVVVPTDALRTQIAEKFLSLGILKAPGSTIIADTTSFPFVCLLRQVPQSVDEVDKVAKRSQVIVTTSHIAGLCKRDVQERLAHHCSHLFIDEAHHAEAPTWKSFKERFRRRRILQFTATPFREDGRPLDGKLIFNYPLRKAQEEEYFKPIRFEPVIEFNPQKADAAIAEKAIEQLRADFDKGHILMARVGTVSRAREVFALYERFPEFNPVELHTGIQSKTRRDHARRQIITGKSRIVVCVDMLGEGVARQQDSDSHPS